MASSNGKLLLVHHGTQKLHDTFYHTQLWQKLFKQQLDGIDRLLLSDQRYPRWPADRQLIRPEIMKDGLYWQSRAWNIAICEALCRGYDWLMLLDTDFVVLQAPSIFPEKAGWAQPLSIWDTPNLTFPPMTARIALAPYAATPFSSYADKEAEVVRASSCFILGRKIFLEHRFNEELIGYGYEDNEFYWGLKRRHGLHQGYTDAILLHLWHPTRANANREVIAANRRRVERLTFKRE